MVYFANQTKTKKKFFSTYLKWPLFWIALLLMKSIYTSVRKNQAPLVLVGQIHSNEAFLSTSFPGNLWRNPIDAAKIHQKSEFHFPETVLPTMAQFGKYLLSHNLYLYFRAFDMSKFESF